MLSIFYLEPKTSRLLLKQPNIIFQGCCCCGPLLPPYFLSQNEKERERGEINKCWVDTIRRRRIILKISAANLVNYEGFLVDSKQREEEEVLWRSLNTNPISKYGKNKVQKNNCHVTEICRSFSNSLVL